MEKTWFNTSITIDGTNYTTPFNSEIPSVPLQFNENGMTFSTTVCNNGVGSFSFDSGNPDVIILDIVVTLIQCQDGENDMFDTRYFNFYLLGETDPFVYEITTGGAGLKTLVITSVDGDQAAYSSELLSVNEQDLTNISMFPNPFSSTIKIESNVTFKNVSIYNMLGQRVTQKVFKNVTNTVSLDLAFLKSGIYFAVMEDELGNTFVERLVKE